PKLPELPGRERYKGRVLQTSNWPHEPVDFTGQRVGVVGTGSSGIQSVPILAQQARELVVFQRTPCFSVPAHNGPVDPAYRQYWNANGPELREQARTSFAGFPPNGEPPVPALSVSAEERQRRYEEAWQRGGLEFMGTFADLFFDKAANATAIDFLHGKVRSLVQKPDVA